MCDTCAGLMSVENMVKKKSAQEKARHEAVLETQFLTDSRLKKRASPPWQRTPRVLITSTLDSRY